MAFFYFSCYWATMQTPLSPSLWLHFLMRMLDWKATCYLSWLLWMQHPKGEMTSFPWKRPFFYFSLIFDTPFPSTAQWPSCPFKFLLLNNHSKYVWSPSFVSGAVQRAFPVWAYLIFMTALLVPPFCRWEVQ